MTNALLLLIPLLCCTACNEKEEQDAGVIAKDVVDVAIPGNTPHDIEKLIVDGIDLLDDGKINNQDPATKV